MTNGDKWDPEAILREVEQRESRNYIEEHPQDGADIDEHVELNEDGNIAADEEEEPDTAEEIRAAHTTLDLSNGALTQNSDVQELVKLSGAIRTIDIYGNKLKGFPSFLWSMKEVMLLDISNNLITDVPVEILNLPVLHDLNLTKNRLIELPHPLLLLPSLRILEANENVIREIPQQIAAMSVLQELHLRGNSIREIPEELTQVRSLIGLDLSDNLLRRLPSTIKNLANLTFLSANKNKIRALPASVQFLGKLEELYLSDNSITNIPGSLGKIPSLRKLDLSRNRITEVPPELGQLDSAEDIDLSGNQITTLPKEMGNLPDWVELNLDGNPLSEPLPALVRRGNQYLFSYLRSLGDGESRYEAKVILIGEGNVGKSSLLAALRGENFVHDRPTTHGIEVNRLTVRHPGLPADVTLNTWDFGGQEVYRITHQFFFSRRALYLLVWKPREGQEENNVEGWCRRIRLRVGDHARVIIVATHSQERRAELDYEHLRSRYPHLLVDYHVVDSESGTGIAELKKALARESSKLPQMGEVWSKSWIKAREEVIGLQDPQITRFRFDAICASYGLDEDETETLSSLLHDLGHIIHYSDDDGLNGIIVLQPEWLTKAIGKVLEDGRTRTKGGVLEHAHLINIWSSEHETSSYPPTLHPYFLRLMEKFDVSYRLPSGNASLVAQLVPYRRPEDIYQDRLVENGTTRVMRTICQLSEEAPGIVAWLTVRNHRFTVGKHWRRGVLLLHSEYLTFAVIELSPENRSLSLTVTGVAPDYLFHILKDGIEELIRSRWSGLRVEFLIPCEKRNPAGLPCIGTFSFKLLSKLRARGTSTVLCHACAEDNDISSLLTGFGKLTAPIDILLNRIVDTQSKLLDRFEGNRLAGAETAFNVRTILKILTQENRDTPRLFTLAPIDRSAILGALDYKSRLRLTLWCEEPGVEHACAAAEYSFAPGKEWLEKAGPYIRFVARLLKFVVPISAAAYASTLSEQQLKDVRADLDLMKTIADKLPEASLVTRAVETKAAMTAAEGAGLRALRVLLAKLDESEEFGGMRRVFSNSGDILWVCPEHYRNYDPGLPNL
jgi:internalin A